MAETTQEVYKESSQTATAQDETAKHQLIMKLLRRYMNKTGNAAENLL